MIKYFIIHYLNHKKTNKNENTRIIAKITNTGGHSMKYNPAKINSTRRNFFKIGVGTVGTLAASQTLAQLCKLNSAEQPLGPFFPRPGTPEIPVTENKNPSTPIYLANDSDLTVVQGLQNRAEGQIVYVKGTVTNAECKPLSGATVIIWQASESGRYNHLGDGANHDFFHPKSGELIKRTLDSSFQYWGKAITDENGEYLFKTIVPGFYPADLEAKWYRPPHIHFMVSATGYPQLVTQMYFSGDKIANNEWIQELNEKDLLLQTKNISKEQRQKLVVEFNEDPTEGVSDGLMGVFDITLTR
jgi:protocatechuate 3,4-dioxygenase, beta subunit